MVKLTSKDPGTGPIPTKTLRCTVESDGTTTLTVTDSSDRTWEFRNVKLTDFKPGRFEGAGITVTPVDVKFERFNGSKLADAMKEKLDRWYAGELNMAEIELFIRYGNLTEEESAKLGLFTMSL